MKNVVNNLYDKYTTKISDELEQDDFYQYFYNLLETGTTLCSFYNRKLIKDVDEEWVDQIEKAIPHLVTVVDFPRRFIEEDRQIVNVALARKFTPESVKHLAQHTHMVNKVNEDGSVEPNKVLNVFKEESLNTYENRFVYTLLMELANFVNKRFEALFEGAKDEDGIKLNLESLIDNYSEVVSYKMEVKIREKQADTANDDNNLNVFTRISKIHKAVLELTSSGFMLEMKKFSMVRHPIVKTNAISKNPDYKACYALWNFLHSYDRVGYKVQILEQDPSISRSFEEDLYNSILMNYVVVRRYMENRDLLSINKERRTREIGLKDIKQFIREVVNEYNIAPEELKKLMMDELNTAIKNKEDLLNKAEFVKEHLRGKKDITIEDSQGWEGFQSAANSDKKETKVSSKISAAVEAVANREKEEAKEQISNEEVSNAFGNSIFSTDINAINKEAIAGGAIDEEILKDARFCKLVRKIEKEKRKRQVKESYIHKKYETVAKSDLKAAQAILDKDEEDKQRKIRKNEEARLREIEKAKAAEEHLIQKENSLKLKAESKKERQLAKEENREKVNLLRKQHREELDRRHEQKLKDRQLDKQARLERKIEEKNNQIDAKKKAAIEREELKVKRTQIRQNQKLEKANLNEQMRKEQQEQARLRKMSKEESIKNSKMRKEQLKAESRMLRVKAKERKSEYKITRSKERKQARIDRINLINQQIAKRKDERELKRIALKRLKEQKRAERKQLKQEQKEARYRQKKEQKERKKGNNK